MNMHLVLRGLLWAFCLPMSLACLSATASAQSVDTVAVARIDAETSRIEDFGADLRVELALSQPVPVRVFTLDAPRRLIADFAEVDFIHTDLSAIVQSDRVGRLAYGKLQDGWSRLVLELNEPMTIETAGVGSGGDGGDVPALKLSLAPTSDAEFEAAAGAPESDLFARPEAELPDPEPARQTGERPLRIVLDPGDGGTGAERGAGGSTGADLVLGLAQDLADGLRNDGHEVTLTRESDTFMSAERRVDIAVETRADLILSLRMRTVRSGGAPGVSVHALGDAARVPAPQDADRSGLLAGLGFVREDEAEGTEAVDAGTAPRSARLAAELAEGLARHTVLPRGPSRQKSGLFMVAAPDIPAVLLELGHASSAEDRSNLSDPAWRWRAIRAVCEAVATWAADDAAEARLLVR